MTLIRDIINELDACPGLSTKNFAVHCYAVEIIEDYISCNGLTVWDEVEKLGTLTENDLLNGAVSWRHYSFSGNSLIWTEDICQRLYERKDVSYHDCLLDIQGKYLESAAQFILHTINRI